MPSKPKDYFNHMSKDIATLLKQATKGLLTEESLGEIKSAFDTAVNERVSIHVEKALHDQDAEYTQKLEHLLEAIDNDHTKKLHKVVQAIDVSNASKLQTVVKKYSQALNEQAKSFKNGLVDKISRYLEVYLETSIPQKAINEAVRNKKALMVLENLRENLAVDSVLMKSSIRDAVIDGQRQIKQASASTKQLQEQVEKLNQQLEQAKANLVFEQKTAHLSEVKKKYARRVLVGKSPEFITENIDYTLSLFDKKEDERLSTLKEEAFEQCVAKEHRVIEETTTEQSTSDTISTPFVGGYLNELSKY